MGWRRRVGVAAQVRGGGAGLGWPRRFIAGLERLLKLRLVLGWRGRLAFG